MAAKRQTVSLTSGAAHTVTFTEAFTQVEVAVTAITAGSTVVIYGDVSGNAAVAGAAELDAVIGGVGAFDTFDAPLNTKSISLIASADCTVLVSRTRRS